MFPAVAGKIRRHKGTSARMLPKRTSKTPLPPLRDCTSSRPTLSFEHAFTKSGGPAAARVVINGGLPRAAARSESWSVGTPLLSELPPKRGRGPARFMVVCARQGHELRGACQHNPFLIRQFLDLRFVPAKAKPRFWQSSNAAVSGAPLLPSRRVSETCKI